MYIQFPDGDERSLEWDEWPDQCFLICDAKFPYADGMSSFPATLTLPSYKKDLREIKLAMSSISCPIWRVFKNSALKSLQLFAEPPNMGTLSKDNLETKTINKYVNHC